jgi:hypothetical protein
MNPIPKDKLVKRITDLRIRNSQLRNSHLLERKGFLAAAIHFCWLIEDQIEGTGEAWRNPNAEAKTIADHLQLLRAELGLLKS